MQQFIQFITGVYFIIIISCYPLGTQGVNKMSPSDPISGQLFNFTPALPF
jgi:hypothetical protein